MGMGAGTYEVGDVVVTVLFFFRLLSIYSVQYTMFLR